MFWEVVTKDRYVGIAWSWKKPEEWIAGMGTLMYHLTCSNKYLCDGEDL